MGTKKEEGRIVMLRPHAIPHVLCREWEVLGVGENGKIRLRNTEKNYVYLAEYDDICWKDENRGFSRD